MAKGKKSVADLLIAAGLASDRTRAEALVMAGMVLLNGEPARKAGQLISEEATVELRESGRYVGRGGLKLEGALSAFQVSAAGKVCADVGASTGGFTDVLLQLGASRVYAIDVGYGELAWKLRNDSRVVLLERTNARDLQSLPEKIDLGVVDVSFISLKLVLPRMRSWLSVHGEIIALVKPQFEAAREKVGAGGIVRDAAVHEEVLRDLSEWAKQQGMGPAALCDSPILGMGGNKEFFLHFVPGQPGLSFDRLAKP